MLDETETPEGERSPVFGQLETLWRRGFLLSETRTLEDGPVLFYRLLPAVRLYAADMLAGERGGLPAGCAACPAWPAAGQRAPAEPAGGGRSGRTS